MLGHILFHIDDAQLLGREWEGASLGKMPKLWINSYNHHLSSLLLSLCIIPQVTEKLLEVENETMMKVADLEKIVLQKDKDLQVIRVSQQL